MVGRCYKTRESSILVSGRVAKLGVMSICTIMCNAISHMRDHSGRYSSQGCFLMFFFSQVDMPIHLYDRNVIRDDSSNPGVDE